MTRRRERDLNAKSNPVSPFVPRVDLSDVPVMHRVTNATTPPGSYSQAHEWRGCVITEERLRAFSLPSKGQRC